MNHWADFVHRHIKWKVIKNTFKEKYENAHSLWFLLWNYWLYSFFMVFMVSGPKRPLPIIFFFRKFRLFYITYQKIGDVCLLVFDLHFFEVKKSGFFQNILFSKNHNIWTTVPISNIKTSNERLLNFLSRKNMDV